MLSFFTAKTNVYEQRIYLSAGLVLLLFIAQLTQAQVYTTKSYKLTIEGTSTMHDWSSSATNVTVQGDFVITNGVIEKLTAAV
ncbi:MAG: hypothetical protein K2X48_02555 [Chitinophagaceae bacterium]|nr:hypothetical protein [Chitinophagaceae bacterium]